MIVIDEHFLESQRQLLKSWRIRFRQIGFEIGRSGLKDPEIIPLLLQHGRLTFFTLDSDFDKLKYCHSHYGIIFLDVEDYEAASFIRRLLKQKEVNTQAKRLGKVIRVTQTYIAIRHCHSKKAVRFAWTD